MTPEGILVSTRNYEIRVVGWRHRHQPTEGRLVLGVDVEELAIPFEVALAHGRPEAPLEVFARSIDERDLHDAADDEDAAVDNDDVVAVLNARLTFGSGNDEVGQRPAERESALDLIKRLPAARAN